MNNDTIRKKGYITNLITDMSIDWMENSRDKKKPFCLLIHHKAIHRNWLPEIKIFHFTKIKSFHCRKISMMITKDVLPLLLRKWALLKIWILYMI